MELNELLKLIILIIALQIGLGVVLYTTIRGAPGVSFISVGLSVSILVVISCSIGGGLYWLVGKYVKERAIKTSLMTLSKDEEKVLREVMHRGKVRQDELSKSLDFSKSKLSALLNNLEEKNAIEKTRQRRTNWIKPTEHFRT